MQELWRLGELGELCRLLFQMGYYIFTFSDQWMQDYWKRAYITRHGVNVSKQQC